MFIYIYYLIMKGSERLKVVLARDLKQYRLEHDLTYEDIENLAGIAASTAYRIENGLVEPQERTLYKLQKAFPDLFSASRSLEGR